MVCFWHVSLSLSLCAVSSPDEVVVPKEDPVVQEVSDVLREWSIIWRKLYIVRRVGDGSEEGWGWE